LDAGPVKVGQTILPGEEAISGAGGRHLIRTIAKIAAVWVKFEVWNIQTVV
jgi:hypothetical protein